ncbi:MAG: flavin oxidoreductase/NADH oxidase [Ruminococcaceae bacterium]|nr:flavin oxidoreductase/NADH oxidase [Oscillospiraceae bacterium]
MEINKTDFCNTELYADILKNTHFSLPQLHLPYCDDTTVLAKEKVVKGKIAHNRICYQPMEGQDADENGNPTDLTFERYERLAKGGAGILWFEAVSVLPEGRSNAHQLMINEKNLDSYKKLVDSVKENSVRNNGYEPIFILQLNHSGRYSKPCGVPAPIVAMRNKFFDKPELSYTFASDEYLKRLPEVFAENAYLCEKAGLDGVDIKCCHGYLYSELLSAYERAGIYGTSFENRTRLLRDTFCACKSVLSHNTILSCRLNIYDGYNTPYSFGTDMNDHTKYNLDEPKKLIDTLISLGLDLLNVTMGSPYVNPDVSRPYKTGIDIPKTNALSALFRLFEGACEIHRTFPDLPIVNTGVSGLCAKSHLAAAGMINDDMTDFVGFGRMNFAYPDLARDILAGEFDPKKACIACSGCSTLKKNGLLSGCIIRNKLYRDIYKEFTSK